MWQGFIWIWPSCGCAQCRGAPSGRAHPRTVWITFAGRMMFRRRSSRPNLEQYLPPWTVTRKVWSDSLSAQHSGVSTDVLLFSDIHLSVSAPLQDTQARSPTYCISEKLFVGSIYPVKLNRTSSEVIRVAFGREPFPADAMQQVVPSYSFHRAAHYMVAMGLWRSPSTQGIRGPLPSATCNACMSCSDCFPDLPQ